MRERIVRETGKPIAQVARDLGGSGNDELYGGDGTDRLSGGDGAYLVAVNLARPTAAAAPASTAPDPAAKS